MKRKKSPEPSFLSGDHGVQKAKDAPSGVVCHIVVTDPATHRKLLNFCQEHRESMWIDCEQSLLSYTPRRQKHEA
jgi:hypothetical protein